MKAIAKFYEGVQFFELSPREREIVLILVAEGYVMAGDNIMNKGVVYLHSRRRK